jgi:hypothetical protein
MSTGEWFEWFTRSDVGGTSPWAYMLEVDILQFAGIAFIFIGVVKKIVHNNLVLAILGVAFAAVSPIVEDIGSQQPYVNYILSLFFGGEEYNFFPFFPWIAYPLVGLYYGELIKKSKDIEKFFKWSLITGIALTVTGIVIITLGYDSMWVDWYKGKFRQGQLPSLVSVMFFGFLGIWLPVCHYITNAIPENRIFTRLYFWSSNVTWFYVVQWIIVGWLCAMIPQLSWPAIIIMIIVIHFITDRVMVSFVKK